MLNALRKRFGQLIPAEYPSDMWFHQMEVVNRSTPDIGKLENKIAHYVFCCDETQVGHKNHRLVPPAFGDTVPPLPPAYTKPMFTLWKKRLGKESYAIPMFNYKPNPYSIYPTADDPKSIKGELHLITPQQFLILDKYKENGKVYQRVQIDVIIPYIKTVRNEYATAEVAYLCKVMPAWTYVGVPSYWKEHLDGGFQFAQVKTVGQTKLNSGYSIHDFIHYPYYQFSLDEYND